MQKSRIPSPARSLGAPATPRRHKTRSSRSVCSPTRSHTSGRLSSVVDQFRENNRDSFAPSPLNKTVLSDTTDIVEPRRSSWWKKVDNSRDVLEVLDNNKGEEVNNILDEIDVEVLSQEKKNYTMDIPDSSDSESISSIVIPQRKLFNHKENQPQNKFSQVQGARESLPKHNKTNIKLDKPANTGPRDLFNHGPKRPKPVFPAALLNMSTDKTLPNKTAEIAKEVAAQPRNLFGNRVGVKRKNMFADFIVSESEDEVSDIQPRVFAFQKNLNPVRHSSKGVRESPVSGNTTDVEMDDWKLLPSSTMVDHQLEAMVASDTPIKRARLSKLSEARESNIAINSTSSAIKSNQSNRSVSKNKSLTSTDKKIANNSASPKNKSKSQEEKEINSDNPITAKNKSKHDISHKNLDDKLVTENNVKNQIKVLNKTANKNLSKSTYINEGSETDIVAQILNDVGTNHADEIAQTAADIPDEADNEQDDEEFSLRYDDNEEPEEGEGTSVNKIKFDVETNMKLLFEHGASDKMETPIETLTEQKEKHTSFEEKSHQGHKVLEETMEEPDVSQKTEEQADNEVRETTNRELSTSARAVEEYNPEEIQSGDQKIEVEADNQQVEVDVDQEDAVDFDEFELENADVLESDNEDELEDEEEEEELEDEKTEDEPEVAVQDSDQEEENTENEELSPEDERETSVNRVEEPDNYEEIDNDLQEDEEIVEEDEVEDNEEENEEPEDNDAEVSQEVEEEDQNEGQEEEEEIQNETSEAEEQKPDESEILNEDQEQGESGIQNDSQEAECQEEDESDIENDSLEHVQGEEEIENKTDDENEILETDEVHDDLDEHYEEHDETEKQDQEIEFVQQSETVNKTHDTTGRNRKKGDLKSPEVLLHNSADQGNSFMVQGRNTSVRKTKSIMKKFSIRPSMAPLRESTGLGDGTTNSSAEGSGWDSHRTTRKTLRQTFGRDFTPRKSLRTLVLEKTARRQTAINEANAELQKPEANSTEMPNDHQDDEMDYEDNVDMAEESDHEMSMRTRQTTLDMYIQKMKKENLERNLRLEQQVRESLIFNTNKPDYLNRAYKPVRRALKTAPKKKTKRCVIPLEDLPSEFLVDMKYKPPKRFTGSNASWITKRLYKFLEIKLEPKYDYKARVRAERLVEMIHDLVRDLRRARVAAPRAAAPLAREMARLGVVRTHFEFYDFCREYLPREVKVKIVPDIVNDIPIPKNGVYADILAES